MFFSKMMFVSKVFGRHHWVGVLLCVIGGTLTVYMDASTSPVETNEAMDGGGGGGEEEESSSSSHSYIGDCFAIAAALMYGLGDCIAEYSVKHIDRHEYLGMLGLFGMFQTMLTFPWIEHDAIRDLATRKQPWQVAGLLLFYIATVLCYYEMEARFLMTSDATLLNLSMQSINLWAVVFTFTADRDSAPSILFFVALILVVSGVFFYEMETVRLDDCLYRLWCCFCCNWTHGGGRRRPSEVEFVQEANSHNGASTVQNYQSLPACTPANENIIV
jgi:solute carrier family 35 protein F1/2